LDPAIEPAAEQRLEEGDGATRGHHRALAREDLESEVTQLCFHPCPDALGRKRPTQGLQGEVRAQFGQTRP
jgi:hypothetical protein